MNVIVCLPVAGGQGGAPRPRRHEPGARPNQLLHYRVTTATIATTITTATITATTTTTTARYRSRVALLEVSLALVLLACCLFVPSLVSHASPRKGGGVVHVGAVAANCEVLLCRSGFHCAGRVLMTGGVCTQSSDVGTPGCRMLLPPPNASL